MKKKIAVFSLAYYPSFVSGAEAAIKEITDRIDRNEIEFHIITLLFDAKAKRYEEYDNVFIHRVGFGGRYLSKILFIPLAALKARQLNATIGIDGMWAMMTYMLMPLTLARLLGVRTNYCLTLQDGDPYEKVFGRFFIKPFLPLIDKGFKDATIIQVLSEYLGTWPARRGYVGEVITVRNGANPKNLIQFYSDQELADVKEKMGKKEGDVYLFIAARMVYQKAMDSIIKALKLLPDNIHFVVAGAGPDEHKLRDLTKDLQLEERVHFLGALTRDEVPLYRNTTVSDIVVHPSRSEGLGNSVLSSMAARLPVIATQVGGFKDYIFDSIRNPESKPTAWAVDPDQPEQIAAAVKEILAQPDRTQAVVENARAMVETEYDWEVVARKMKTEVFNKLF